MDSLPNTKNKKRSSKRKGRAHISDLFVVLISGFEEKERIEMAEKRKGIKNRVFRYLNYENFLKVISISFFN